MLRERSGSRLFPKICCSARRCLPFTELLMAQNMRIPIVPIYLDHPQMIAASMPPAYAAQWAQLVQYNGVDVSMGLNQMALSQISNAVLYYLQNDTRHIPAMKARLAADHAAAGIVSDVSGKLSFASGRKEKSGSSAGKTVGIVLGALAGVAAVVLLLVSLLGSSSDGGTSIIPDAQPDDDYYIGTWYLVSGGENKRSMIFTEDGLFSSSQGDGGSYSMADDCIIVVLGGLGGSDRYEMDTFYGTPCLVDPSKDRWVKDEDKAGEFCTRWREENEEAIREFLNNKFVFEADEDNEYCEERYIEFNSDGTYTYRSLFSSNGQLDSLFVGNVDGSADAWQHGSWDITVRWDDAVIELTPYQSSGYDDSSLHDNRWVNANDVPEIINRMIIPMDKEGEVDPPEAISGGNGMLVVAPRD